jgi:hypothetical protein
MPARGKPQTKTFLFPQHTHNPAYLTISKIILKIFSHCADCKDKRASGVFVRTFRMAESNKKKTAAVYPMVFWLGPK